MAESIGVLAGCLTVEEKKSRADLMRKDMRRREKKVKSCLDGLFALADPTIKTCLKTFELVSKQFLASNGWALENCML